MLRVIGAAARRAHGHGQGSGRAGEKPAKGSGPRAARASTREVMDIGVTRAVVSVLTVAVIRAFGRQLQDAAETGY